MTSPSLGGSPQEPRLLFSALTILLPNSSRPSSHSCGTVPHLLLDNTSITRLPSSFNVIRFTPLHVLFHREQIHIIRLDDLKRRAADFPGVFRISKIRENIGVFSGYENSSVGVVEAGDVPVIFRRRNPERVRACLFHPCANRAESLCNIHVYLPFAAFGAAATGGATVISIAFSVFMLVIDTLVSFIQAYVFTMLSTIFIGLAQEGGHEEHETIKENN